MSAIRPARVNTETARELVRVLVHPKFGLDAAEREQLLGEFLPWAEVVDIPDPPPPVPTCPDPDGGMCLVLAAVGEAEYPVTGDDLLVELPHPGADALGLSLRLSARTQRRIGLRRIDVLVADPAAPVTPLLARARRDGMALSLDPAVGRARAGRHRLCRQGAHRSHGLCHGEDAQRRWRGRGRLGRVCSVLTLGVRPVVGRTFSPVKHLPAEASGQLPDLG